jgi:hypothetical protein
MQAVLSRRRQAMKSNKEAKRTKEVQVSSLSETSVQLSEASVLLSDVEASVTAFTQQLSAGFPTILRPDQSLGVDTNDTTSNMNTMSFPDRSLVADGGSAETVTRENCLSRYIEEKWEQLAIKLLKQQIIWSDEKIKRIREVVTVFERAERARDIELSEATRLRYCNEFIGSSASITSRDANEVLTNLAHGGQFARIRSCPLNA